MRINRLTKNNPLHKGNVCSSTRIHKTAWIPLIGKNRLSPLVLVLLPLIGLLSAGYFNYDVFAARTNHPLHEYTVFSPIIFKQSTYTPERVYILEDHTHYKSSSSGYLHIVGEIQNDRHYIISNVVIKATLYNKEKKSLASESTSLYLSSLMPGDKTCFDITFTEIPSGWSTYGFDDPTYTIGGQRLPDISITRSMPNLDDDDLEISGSAHNDESVRVEYVRPVGTVYNASDQVIGCQDTYLDGYYTYLNRGSTGSFTLMYYGRDYTKWEYYRIQVGGILP